MPIEFDKHIPIPEPINRTKYEFDRMEVGDSKFWPGDAAGKAVAAHVAKTGKGFTTRKVKEVDPESGETVSGVRVWRTK